MVFCIVKDISLSKIARRGDTRTVPKSRLLLINKYKQTNVSNKTKNAYQLCLLEFFYFLLLLPSSKADLLIRGLLMSKLGKVALLLKGAGSRNVNKTSFETTILQYF